VKTLGEETRWNGSIDDEAATTNTVEGSWMEYRSGRKLLKK